jgi:hypothetical protein
MAELLIGCRWDEKRTEYFPVGAIHGGCNLEAIGEQGAWLASTVDYFDYSAPSTAADRQDY